ncbi:MAG: GerMN domain-containing protein [Vicinamibacterales bacterium]
MMRTRGILVLAVAALAALIGWGLFVGLPRWVEAQRATPPPPPIAEAPAEPERKIRARLFYVADDGYGLVAVEREVAYGADPSAQIRAILQAQMAEPPAPLVSAVPPGTQVRAVYVTGGEAYVDLSREVVTGHTGGSLNEQLTVQTLVAAVTVNLPAVTRVQLLVDGKEVDTLAGHVDLRQPLARNDGWMKQVE